MPDKDLDIDLSLKLLPQVQQLIAAAVNADSPVLYWQIGKLLKENVLEGERAANGKHVISRLSAELTTKYGKGWSPEQWRHCLRAAKIFRDEQIVYALCTKLSWPHFRKLVFIGDGLNRLIEQDMKFRRWSLRRVVERSFGRLGMET